MKQKMRFKAEAQNKSLWFAGGSFSVDADGDLEIRTNGSGWLTADQFLEIVAAFPCEPVPEPKTPGQVLYEAAATEDGEPGAWDAWEDCDSETRDYYERTAARVGIKGEG